MASTRLSSSSSEDSSDVADNDNNKYTNAFRNDGSFLEIFKKMQKATQGSNSSSNSDLQTPPGKTKNESKKQDDSKPAKPLPMVGRRRCTKALPVGKVKKLKAENEESKKPPITDAWAKYLEEVKKYKETYCDSEAKNRSLVK